MNCCSLAGAVGRCAAAAESGGHQMAQSGNAVALGGSCELKSFLVEFFVFEKWNFHELLVPLDHQVDLGCLHTRQLRYAPQHAQPARHVFLEEPALQVRLEAACSSTSSASSAAPKRAFGAAFLSCNQLQPVPPNSAFYFRQLPLICHTVSSPFMSSASDGAPKGAAPRARKPGKK